MHYYYARFVVVVVVSFFVAKGGPNEIFIRNKTISRTKPIIGEEKKQRLDVSLCVCICVHVRVCVHVCGCFSAVVSPPPARQLSACHITESVYVRTTPPPVAVLKGGRMDRLKSICPFVSLPV